MRLGLSLYQVDFFMIVSSLQREFESIEHLDALITEQLGQGLAEDDPATWPALDERIIAETETLGWRIFSSTLVQMRLCAWESQPGGIQLYQRFSKALVKFARIMQRQTLPPIDRRIHQHKRATVNELRLAFKILRSKLTTLRKTPRPAQRLKMFRQVIAEGSFDSLTANLDSWNAFLTAEAAFISDVLGATRFAPAAIYDAWLAWATGHAQEALRQKIATLKQ